MSESAVTMKGHYLILSVTILHINILGNFGLDVIPRTVNNAVEHDSLTLQCLEQGVPPLEGTVEWFQNGSRIQFQSKRRYPKTLLAESFEFSGDVDDVFHEDMQKTYSFVKEEPNDLDLVPPEGEDVYDGSGERPDTGLSNSYTETYLPPGNTRKATKGSDMPTLDQHDLVFEDLRFEDSGFYTCSWTKGGVVTTSSSYNLMVMYPPGRPELRLAASEHSAVDVEFKMHCILRDKGNPSTTKYTWYKLGDADTRLPLAETNDAMLEHTERTSGEHYYACSAENEAGSSSDSHPLIVFVEAPVAIESPTKDFKITPDISDKTVRLSVTISGTNLNEFTWIKDGSHIENSTRFTMSPLRNETGRFRYGQQQGMQSSLDISLLQEDTCQGVKSFGGVYWLEATGTVGGVTNTVSSAHATVYSPLIWDPQKPQDIPVNLGEEVVIHCSVCSSPSPDVAMVKWIFFNNHLLPENVTVGNDTIRVKKVEEEHFGEYICQVPYATGVKKFPVRLRNSKAILPLSSESTNNEDDNLILIVSIVGGVVLLALIVAFALGIKYRKNTSHSRIPTDEENVVNGRNTMELQNARNQDEEAQNALLADTLRDTDIDNEESESEDEHKNEKSEDGGEKDDSEQDYKAKLPISAFLVPLKNLKSSEGEHVKFECRVFPSNEKVTWLMNNLPIVQSSKYNIHSGSDGLHQLTIQNVQVADTGIFTAELSAEVRSEAKLTVKDVFKKKISDQTCIEKQNATFECVTSRPDTSVTWVCNGEIVDEYTEYDVISKNGTHKLTINNVHVTHHGLKVEARIDGEQTQASLTVKGPPGPPQSPEVSDVTKSSCTLRWKPPELLGNCDIRGYIIKKLSMSRDDWVQATRGLIQDTTHRLNDLVSEETYMFCIEAVNEVGVSDPSEATKPIVAEDKIREPDRPGTPEITEVNMNNMEFQWKPPLKDGGATVLGYNVEMRETSVKSKGHWRNAMNGQGIPRASYKATGLRGQEYEFRVTAFNKAGKSEPSNPSQVAKYDPPGAPTDIAVSDIKKSSCLLTWKRPQYNGKSLIGYRLEMKVGYHGNWTKVNHDPIQQTGYRFVDLIEDEVYDFRVRATAQGGNSKYSESTGTVIITERPIKVPGSPIPPRAKLSTTKPGKVIVSFDQPDLDMFSSHITEYLIAEKIGENEWKHVADVPATHSGTLQYEAQIQAPGQTHQFRVTARNAGGNSAPSAPTNVILYEPPPSPINVEATSLTSTSWKVKWTMPDLTPTIPVTGCVIEARAGQKKTWEPIKDPVFINSKEYTVVGLTENVNYHFRVSAVSKGGVSLPSEPTSIPQITDTEEVIIDSSDIPSAEQGTGNKHITPNKDNMNKDDTTDDLNHTDVSELEDTESESDGDTNSSEVFKNAPLPGIKNGHFEDDGSQENGIDSDEYEALINDTESNNGDYERLDSPRTLDQHVLDDEEDKSLLQCIEEALQLPQLDKDQEIDDSDVVQDYSDKESEPLIKDREAIESPISDRESEPLINEKETSEPLIDDKEESEPLINDKEESEPLFKDREESESLINDKEESEALINDREESEALINDREESEALINDKEESEPLVNDKEESEPLVKDREESEALINDKEESEPLVNDKEESVALVNSGEKSEPLISNNNEGESNPETMNMMEPKTEKIIEDLPGPPTNLQVLDRNNTSCLLTWDPPEGNYPCILYYILEIKCGSEGDWGEVNRDPIQETYYRFTNLKKETYYFSVYTTNEFGESEDPAETMSMYMSGGDNTDPLLDEDEVDGMDDDTIPYDMEDIEEELEINHEVDKHINESQIPKEEQDNNIGYSDLAPGEEADGENAKSPINDQWLDDNWVTNITDSDITIGIAGNEHHTSNLMKALLGQTEFHLSNITTHGYHGMELTFPHPKNKNIKFALISNVKKFRRQSSAHFIFRNNCKIFLQLANSSLSNTEAEFLLDLRGKEMKLACIIPPESEVQENNLVDEVFQLDLNKQPSLKKIQRLLRYLIEKGNAEED